MIRIKLAEMDTHRNETTFRPIGWASSLFEEIGIEFTPYEDCDYTIVSQASIIDKSLPLDEAVEKGLEFLSTIKGDYIILSEPSVYIKNFFQQRSTAVAMKYNQNIFF